MKDKIVVLVVFDGFGVKKDKKFNGVLNADMKNYFDLWNNYPHTVINASEEFVGLPIGQMGSSEVGHLTMGAGRLVKQPILRINEDVRTGEFKKNKKLVSGLKYVSKSKGNVHLMGLLGPGGVHSHSDHLYSLMEFYDENCSKFSGKVFIHNFLDGRDVAQCSAKIYLKELENKIKKLKNSDRFVLSTVSGRYYSMDRDKRWTRTNKSLNMFVKGNAKKVTNWSSEIDDSYSRGVFDEFVEPFILDLEPVKENDLCLFYNFRSDRPRQLIKRFFDVIPNLKFQTLTEYSPDFKVDVLYPNIYPKKTLGEILSKKGLSQLRISESEKFPHVTYFFNGLKFEPFKNETQINVPSPKVATYDLKPEMNARILTEKVCKAIESKKYNFVLINYANSDMVGHTGSYDAILKALKCLDGCLGDLKKSIDKVSGTMVFTADHGNCEDMRDENDKPHTKHTVNLVPFILCDNDYKLREGKDLSLSNVAPTILDVFGIKKPKEMAGVSLIDSD